MKDYLAYFCVVQNTNYKQLQRIIETTGDGSKTIYLPEMDERYHSKHGAWQEAMHVFIEMGLKQLNYKEISILEVGFGTGLNALLTAVYAEKNGLKVNYKGLEAFPVANDMAMQMGYTTSKAESDIFEQMHSCNWESWEEISPFFKLFKHQQKLQSFVSKSEFDLIYFDAFGPRVQDEMWVAEIFDKLYTAMKPKGILTTYCAKGSVRRNMQAAGFEVQRLPGPPGKREMLRALKK